MKKVRVIPRLDVKGPNVVKGLQLEGLRVIGNPADLAKKYYEQGADEILYIDIVASLYERNNLRDIVEQTCSSGIYIPITVGGGIRTIEDIKQILRAGADKVAINTAAVKNPDLIKTAAQMFGSQCIVGSIEAKKKSEGKWEAYIDNGRERTNLDVFEWAKKLEELGAGEILLVSVDREGMQKGFDKELIKKITESVSIPVIACGGASSEQDINDCFDETKCDAVAFASILHYNKATITSVKDLLKENNIPVRLEYPKADLTKAEKKKTVSIIDYNVGNIKSVITAFQNLGNEVKLIDTPEEIEQAELLVLPGDGAFGYAMSQLEERNLIQAMNKYVESGKPLFGICLGMQLLMSESEEFGHHKGLNLVKGNVKPFLPRSKVSERGYCVPHMGWNEMINPDKVWNGMMTKVPDKSEVYFVHSFYVEPEDPEVVVANTEYGGQTFCSVLRKKNVFATQFHPEKSGEIGMSMLKYFSSL